METLQNYLESMFARLPINREVLRAKEELFQMMEDKYNGLLSEGKSENEAIGTVISEFGNLDELADILGIGEFVKPVSGNSENSENLEYRVSRERIEAFLVAKKEQAFRVALGVALCTLSICGVTFGSQIGPDGVFGIVLFFVFVAAGVCVFIIAQVMMGKWDDIRNKGIMLDFSTRKFIEDEKERYRNTHSLSLAVGIMFCILSVLPPIILDSFRYASDIEELSVTLMFLLVAAGVFLIVHTSIINGGYTSLLEKSGQNINGNSYSNTDGYTDDHNEYVYNSNVLAAVMSVYWPTVTCLYLSVSFLSFDWHITWIIWPIAAICGNLINSTCGRKVK